jgi:hypothetical protein
MSHETTADTTRRAVRADTPFDGLRTPTVVIWSYTSARAAKVVEAVDTVRAGRTVGTDQAADM